MKLALAYVHQHQSYLGGLLRRAAKRLGIEVVTIGPKNGSWIGNAPIEDGWEPDIECGHVGLPVESLGHFDVLINVDQGDGFYLTSTRVPIAHCFTEGNSGEYERGVKSGAAAMWSCMPLKDAGKRIPGLLYLQWGYDSQLTWLTDCSYSHSSRAIDFTLHGSWSERRQAYVDAIASRGLRVDAGPPLSRAEWGQTLRDAKITLCDGDESYLTGRIVDAMASGCLVLAKPSPVMDMIAPRGYVAITPLPDGRIVPENVADVVMEYLPWRKRLPITEQAQQCVAHLSYDNQLLRILGSVGVRP